VALSGRADTRRLVLRRQAAAASTCRLLLARTWRAGQTYALHWDAAEAGGAFDAEYSLAGDFSDAATLFSAWAGPSWSWTIPADLVDAETATARVRIRHVVGGVPSPWEVSKPLFIVPLAEARLDSTYEPPRTLVTA